MILYEVNRKRRLCMNEMQNLKNRTKKLESKIECCTEIPLELTLNSLSDNNWNYSCNKHSNGDVSIL